MCSVNLGQEWMNRVKSLTELENTKKNQTELKDTITEIKNTLDVINSGLDNTEEQISKQEVRVMEITQAEQKKELMKMRIA